MSKNYSENWIDVYKNKLGEINFTSGDYDGLKEIIRKYVSMQNPENINDWQESSETGLFVNAIAYLGENINYRCDLNVNDLFPSTTKRKESLLNFTKMLSYAAKRNRSANGLAKITSVSTTQDIYDSLGNSLKDMTVLWNDLNNNNWQEQFLTILNSSFSYTNQFGKPLKKISINNISNQLYQLTSAVNNSTVYKFTRDVNNTTWSFEIVNPNIDVYNNAIIENDPAPENAFHILYRNDGTGNNSINTGFYLYFKQGTLYNSIYNFNEKIENNKIDVDIENINNDDVWFQELDIDTNYVLNTWTKVSDSEQLSYTSTDNDIRTIYKVETKEDDKICVKFSDGYFGDIPFGRYRLWYRTSNANEKLYLKPSDISNVSIVIPYYSNKNENENNVYYLTLTFSVVDVSHIMQSVQSESIENIRENAPDIYSTQDRMVSGKDYNKFPKSIGQDLRVLKSILRTHSGNSRYTQMNDTSGTYTPANILATDGYIYSKDEIITTEEQLASTNNDEILYKKYIESELSSKEISNLYYKYYNGVNMPLEDNLYYYFIPTNIDFGSNKMVGHFISKTPEQSESNGSVIIYDISNNTNMGIVDKNDILCFVSNENEKIWVTVTEIKDNGTDFVINEVLDVNKEWKLYKGNSDEKIYSKVYSFVSYITPEVQSDIIEKMVPRTGHQTSFGLIYVNNPSDNNHWKIIDFYENPDWNVDDEIKYVDENGNETSENPYSINWIFKIDYNDSSKIWKFSHRETKIIFGSEKEVSFFFNTYNKTNESSGYFITQDVIKMITSNNNQLKDYYWKPYDVITYIDGHTDTQEFCCEGWDSDKDSEIDIPQQLNVIQNLPNDLIFMENEDSTDRTFLNYIDLKNNYQNFGENENERAFNSSLWQHTNISGYYYTYHKINQLIPAGTIIDNQKLYYPIKENVILSNGEIKTFNGASTTIINQSLDYDFVDYIKGYNSYNEPVFFDDILEDGSEKHGYLYYLYIDNNVKKLQEIDSSSYEVVLGEKGITFLWKHYPTSNYVIDPCTTNIIDMYVLTKDYYNEVNEWIQDGKSGLFPVAPSSYELKSIFKSLEDNKMVSDTIVWHPIKYRLIFGSESDPETRCIFKVIKSNELITDNEVKKQVISLTDKFFQNMTVGESFYFTQLSTYIENNIPEMIKTVLIVPTNTDKKFGQLFELQCEDDEILLSTATLNDVQIISTITEKNIRIS